MPPFFRYQFDVSNAVRLKSDPQLVFTVRWRTSILCSDRVRRAVYQLDNYYWDMYYEDELREAFRNLD